MGWREYHGGPAKQIFLCDACEGRGWGRQVPRIDSLYNSMRDQLPDQVARREEYRMIWQHLWDHELMAALDENARLLKNGDYNMLVCHMILVLL